MAVPWLALSSCASGQRRYLHLGSQLHGVVVQDVIVARLAQYFLCCTLPQRPCGPLPPAPPLCRVRKRREARSSTAATGPRSLAGARHSAPARSSRRARCPPPLTPAAEHRLTAYTAGPAALFTNSTVQTDCRSPSQCIPQDVLCCHGCMIGVISIVVGVVALFLGMLLFYCLFKRDYLKACITANRKPNPPQSQQMALPLGLRRALPQRQGSSTHSLQLAQHIILSPCGRRLQRGRTHRAPRRPMRRRRRKQRSRALPATAVCAGARCVYSRRLSP